MVAVGYVERIDACEDLCDAPDVLVVVDDPKLVAEAVIGRDEVVDGGGRGVLGHDSVYLRVVLVGEKDRFDVGVVDADVLHAVFLFVPAGEFMLLDRAVHVIRDVCPDDQPVLCLAVHRLGIDVVAFFAVLHEPSLFLELLEILCRLGVDPLVVLVSPDGEVDFWLYDVVEGHLVALSLGARLFRVEHVVGA